MGCYGDGGALFTNDHKIAEKLSWIRIHGSGISQYENVRLELNGRMDTIQAAIYWKYFVVSRRSSKREVGEFYTSKLSSAVSLKHPKTRQ